MLRFKIMMTFIRYSRKYENEEKRNSFFVVSAKKTEIIRNKTKFYVFLKKNTSVFERKRQRTCGKRSNKPKKLIFVFFVKIILLLMHF